MVSDTTNPYFLGSIILIRNSVSQRHYDIVDGQQRLTSLTILLSVLRHLEQGQADGITKLIYQMADGVSVFENIFRLTLRETDAVFFQDYIQKQKPVDAKEDGIDKIQLVNRAELSDSQRCICKNTVSLLEKLSKMSSSQRQNIIRFVASRCLLVRIIASDQDSAFRVFSVMNSRGLELSHTDIFKADILGGVPKEQQDIYVRKWNKLEEDLTREKFQDLFSYIRMIYRRQKLKGTILKEFYEYVKPQTNPRDFIDHILTPYAEAYGTIEKADYNHENSHDEINTLFKMLMDHDNSDWIPPAIYYLAHRDGNAAALLRFFKDLERLAAYLMLSRATINERINRYGQLLETMKTILQPEAGAMRVSDDILYADNSPLQLTEDEKQEMLKILNADVYKHSDNLYILLRLNSELSEDRGYHKYRSNTIEHVLPQTPPNPSEWLTWFPNEDERKQWTNRLANLVLLSGRKNPAASNHPLSKKIETYFRSRNKVADYALTTVMIDATEWTPEVLQERQSKYIGVLQKMWRLD